MRKSGKTSNRPEQLLAKELIEEHGQGITFIDTEYSVTDIKVADYIDLRGERMPRLDIVVFKGDEKIGIRCNGGDGIAGFHDSRTKKDSIQKSVLEHPSNNWKIVDFDHKLMPTLFLNWKSANKPDIKMKILQEIKSHLIGIITIKIPKKTMLTESQVT